jgi:hypothetical protein
MLPPRMHVLCSVDGRRRKKFEVEVQARDEDQDEERKSRSAGVESLSANLTCCPGNFLASKRVLVGRP